eukprot:2847097-Rhodomonas_salina.6
MRCVSTGHGIALGSTILHPKPARGGKTVRGTLVAPYAKTVPGASTTHVGQYQALRRPIGQRTREGL